MPEIMLLDDSLINKIAAGEVIERPASVVKELIENSIDAGAKKIFIEIKEGGISYIRVTDDGEGMERKDARLSLLRHSTSKIRSARELFNISTLGFRGEALASIASVSELELRSCTGASEGISIVSRSGKIISEKSVVMPRGTTVLVRDLFENVPARKKHLKTIETETRKIVDVVMHNALINHTKYIELVQDKKVLINSPPAQDIRNNIANLLGADLAKELISIGFTENGIGIYGEISRPGYQRSSRGLQAIYINGRYVRNRAVSDAVYSAYHTLLNVNKHPAFFLDIRLDPAKIDVNVHPQKLQVRLEKEEAVSRAVASAVGDALQGDKEAFRPKDIKLKGMALSSGNGSANKDSQSLLIERQAVQPKPASGFEKEKMNPKVREYRVLGQVLNTYIILSDREGMLIVDQHAAQERVLYERFMGQFRGMAVERQRLIEPMIIEVTPGEKLLVHENLAQIAGFGFDVQEFGRNSFLLRTVPMVFDRLQGRDVFLSILDELKSGRSRRLDEAREERIIRKACRASVKANAPLEKAELTGVIQDLFSAENPQTCPHGRPTMLRLTQDDLEKMFRRKGL